MAETWFFCSHTVVSVPASLRSSPGVIVELTCRTSVRLFLGDFVQAIMWEQNQVSDLVVLEKISVSNSPE